MNRTHFFSLFLGMILGVVLAVGTLRQFGIDPDSYRVASAPAIQASGQDGVMVTAETLRIALNPCIVNGPLPDECRKYILNGVATQPPIKIMVDTSK